jgi:hypothetical protein
VDTVHFRSSLFIVFFIDAAGPHTGIDVFGLFHRKYNSLVDDDIPGLQGVEDASVESPVW